MNKFYLLGAYIISSSMMGIGAGISNQDIGTGLTLTGVLWVFLTIILLMTYKQK